MKSLRMFLTLAAGALPAAFVASQASADPVPPINFKAELDPGLSGTTSYDGWGDFSSTNYSGYPAFGSTAAWPSPIGSNQSGGSFNAIAPGDAVLSKISGAAIPQTSSIYFSGFSGTPDTLDGTLAVSDATPVSGIKIAVLQVEIGAAFGYDFYQDLTSGKISYPTLSYNGGTQALTATPVVEYQVQNGTFTDPTTGDDDPVYLTTYGFTWNLSGITTPITSISTQWSEVEHSQLYSIRLDEGTVVPEPASLGFIGLSSLALLRRKRAV